MATTKSFTEKARERFRGFRKSDPIPSIGDSPEETQPSESNSVLPEESNRIGRAGSLTALFKNPFQRAATIATSNPSTEHQDDSSCSTQAMDKECKKKPGPIQPKGTFEYVVKNRDKLTSLAACFDTTPSVLKKVNRLAMDYLYTGQILYIPDKDYQCVKSSATNTPTSPVSPKVPEDMPFPGHVERMETSCHSITDVNNQPPKPLSEEEAQYLDKECFQRFIKVDSHYITDSHTAVCGAYRCIKGTLLVTPNAVMFDPDVSDPQVIEKGPEEFGMIAKMDTVMSAAIYHDIGAMHDLQARKSDPNIKKPDVYHKSDCDLMRRITSTEGISDNSTNCSDSFVKISSSEVLSCSCGADSALDNYKPTSADNTLIDTAEIDAKSDGLSKCMNSPSPTDDMHIDVDQDSPGTENDKDANMTSHHDPSRESSKVRFELDANHKDELSGSDESQVDRNDKEQDENLQQNEREERGEPYNIALYPLAHKRNTSAASAVSSTYSSVQLSTSVDTFVDYDSGLFTNPNEHTTRSNSAFYIEPAQHTGNSSFYTTPDFTCDNFAAFDDCSSETSASGNSIFYISCDAALTSGKKNGVSPRGSDYRPAPHRRSVELEGAVKISDAPNLFKSLHGMITSAEIDETPLYLCLRVGQPINKSVSKTCPIESYSKKKRPEYWFSIPRSKVDSLYAFFIEWRPEVYGDGDDDAREKGFVALCGDNPDGIVSSSPRDCQNVSKSLVRQMSRDWEIVSLEEIRRRKSLLDIEKYLPLPTLDQPSQIMNDEHIRELSKCLPARVEGYPWQHAYSSEEHGFSLTTMYRKMQEYDSPVLLLIKTTEDQVFGALSSCEFKLSEHFYGTGESFLFTFVDGFKTYCWSGCNNFFNKGNQSSLCIGAGDGSYGIWLDGDIYHGTTQNCQTYANDPLTGGKEDFIVKHIEAWCFHDEC